eukprot:6945940-Lingulodinium_polyedra.AAC.1
MALCRRLPPLGIAWLPTAATPALARDGWTALVVPPLQNMRSITALVMASSPTSTIPPAFQLHHNI